MREKKTMEESTVNSTEVKRRRSTRNNMRKEENSIEKKEIKRDQKREVKKDLNKDSIRERAPKREYENRKRNTSKFEFKKDNLKIIPLGGLDEIGKNITVFEYGKPFATKLCKNGDDLEEDERNEDPTT